MPGLSFGYLELGLIGSYSKGCQCHRLVLLFEVVTPPVALHASVAQTAAVVGHLVWWCLAIW